VCIQRHARAEWIRVLWQTDGMWHFILLLKESKVLILWSQKIQYAKTKSDTIAKLDGTFKIPTFAQPEEAEATSDDQPTDLQRAVFGAPPAAGKAAAEPPAGKDKSEESKGVKRGREEEDEEDSDGSAMEMEESDDE
jgi:U2 small nuclear ribonucleoprotein B''